MEYVSKNTTKIFLGYTKEGEELFVSNDYLEADTFKNLLQTFLKKDLEAKTRKRIKNAINKCDSN